MTDEEKKDSRQDADEKKVDQSQTKPPSPPIKFEDDSVDLSEDYRDDR